MASPRPSCSHQASVRRSFAVLGLDGGQDRPTQGHDRDSARLFARHRRDGRDARRWVDLPAICRFIVGLGVTGLYSVDITLVQEFVPASKRGWLTGLTTTMLPVGVLLGALLGGFATPYI